MGSSIRTDAARNSDVQGTFTLILYGGNFSDDLETTAFLDREGDGYTFEPYAPDFTYRVRKGLPADVAVHEARTFISGHAEFRDEQLRSIRDSQGNIMGYELRPLYFPMTHGTDNVIDVYYRFKDSKVLITIMLKPFLEKARQEFNPDK